MTPITANEEPVEVCANAVWSSIPEEELLIRDPISAGRAVLWLAPTSYDGKRGNCAAFIARGIARVSLLVQRQEGETAAVQVGDRDGKSTRLLWIPAVVRAMPAGLVSTKRRDRRGQDARWSSSSTQEINVSAAADVGAQLPSALLSPCLSEALGLPSAGDAARNVSMVMGGIVRLRLRELHESIIAPAALVELHGPYPLTTGRPGETGTSGDSDDKSYPPPSSLVAAVSSILPCALDGEVLAQGSVLRVAGLFGVVVAGVWTHQERKEKEVDGQSSPSTGDVEGIAARVHSATELRLVPPMRPKRAPAAAASEACSAPPTASSPLAAPSEEHEGSKPQLHPEAQHSNPNLAPFSAPPSYLSRSFKEWIRNVGQDFGGLGHQVATAVAVVGTALSGNQGGGDSGMGLNAPARGLLLHGPTGAGKTLLARSVTEHSGAPWFFLDCSSVFRRDRGKAEKYVQDFLTKAAACSPSVVVLDQVETVSRKRPEAAGVTELQVFSVLLEAMDRFRCSARRVFFLATCPDPTALDPSVLQRGRLEVALRMGDLDGPARASILDIHARGMKLQLRQPSVTAGATPDSSSKGDPESGEAETLLADGSRDTPDTPHCSDKADAPLEAVRGAVGTPRLPRTRMEFVALVAARCHGYLGSDLERLCREAAMRHMAAVPAATAFSGSIAEESGRTPVLEEVVAEPPAVAIAKAPRGRRAMESGDTHEGSGSGGVAGGGVGLDDFWAALDVVRPASLAGHSVGMWGGDVGPEGELTTPLVGCDDAMTELRAFLLAPLANPSLLQGLGLRAATGALLHGPPGCGKTSVARALAAESRGVANFLEVRCSDLVDKVVGRSERAVADLFAAARAAAPCVLFLDQVEGVAARRGYHSSTEQTFDRILSTLLVEMDGVMSESGGHVVVLAATNDITRLDPALLRPGRLDRRVYLGPPNIAARVAVFRQRLLGMPLQVEEDCNRVDSGGVVVGNGGEDRSGRDWVLDSTEAYAKWLAGETEGCSGAQLTGVCREAALAALREGIQTREVARRHFSVALRDHRRHAVSLDGGVRR